MSVRSVVVRLVVLSCGLVLAAHPAQPQSVQTSIADAPALEVASIRPSTSSGPMRVRANPGRVDVNGATLEDLIRNAFGEPTSIPTYRLGNVAPWMQNERFDILASFPSGAPPLTPQSTQLALRRLLMDRFKVTVRSEVSEGAVYVLSVLREAKGLTVAAPCTEGAPTALSGAPPRPCDAIRIKGGQRFVMDGTGVRMAQLAGQLSAIPAISRVVVDRTGMTERYDFRIEWAPPTAADAVPAGAAGQEAGPSIFAALEEQLGLKLEPGRGAIERLIIVSAERPSKN